MKGLPAPIPDWECPYCRRPMVIISEFTDWGMAQRWMCEREPHHADAYRL